MTEIINKKRYDLEERTFNFSKQIRMFIKKLPKITVNFEDMSQLLRSSGSIGANYIEANEAISKKDFLFRIKISRKEAKESCYWLKLLDTNNNPELEMKRGELINEVTELMKIFSAIMRKCQ